MDDKWNMTDEQLIEILRGLGNAARKMNRNYDRTIYDVAADRIERLLRSSGLTFDALRAANMARLPEFRDRHGEPAHKEPDGSDWSPAQWLQAIVGELGEYANIRKKFERGDLTPEEFYAAAADELADVQCYLDILAWQLNIDLGRATMEKWNRVSERIGSDIRLGPDDWYRVKPADVLDRAFDPEAKED